MEDGANQSGFQMKIEDIFEITGRGTVASGHILSGRVQVGDTIHLTTRHGQSLTCQVKAIEQNRKVIREAAQGGRIGLLLSDVKANDLVKGSLISLDER